MKAIAQANSNIALIKYWGKRESSLNLPAVGSISVTLAEMKTVSQVHFQEALKQDHLLLNDKEALSPETVRVSKFLDIVREIAGLKLYADVKSHNNFPTGAGLASSASAFASLALASSQAAGLKLSPAQLSVLARRGSGSAARSLFGGFVEDENYWDIQLLIAITSERKKDIGSTSGMDHTARTSPYYHDWVNSSTADLKDMRQAISKKDFSKLGELTEFSCLKMHAAAMSANPGLVYWNATTIECLHTIYDLRRQGCEVYFTIDAGPQVKAIFLSANTETVKNALENTRGVVRVISSELGGNAALLERIDWNTL
jgi:diphosphomevalonate decarboxylase